MFSLENELNGFEKKYGRKITHNPKDDMFYETVKDKLQPAIILFKPAIIPLDTEEEKVDADMELADIITHYADDLVCKKLTKKGLMREANGDYRPIMMGVCHTFWREKKEILKRYGINWRSPQDMNPGIFYD